MVIGASLALPTFADLRESGRTKVSTDALSWFAAYRSGRYLDVQRQEEASRPPYVAAGGDEECGVKIAIGGPKHPDVW